LQWLAVVSLKVGVCRQGTAGPARTVSLGADPQPRRPRTHRSRQRSA